MRAQVRVLLANGSSREDVLDWFRARYGPGIVAEPPRSGFNLIAWIVPGVAVAAGIIGGVLALRAMRRRSSGSYDGDISGSDADLQPYLATVDRELALGRQSPEGPSDG
jgi:cytochrome c-type biogenesis protein CcmH